MRQIVLDTETTGLEISDGHRIIEIGCVELINRRLTGNNFHVYLQPDRKSDPGAVEVHGITDEFLADKPRFADVVDEFMAYIDGSELVIHNAPFDIGFMNHELNILNKVMGTQWQPSEHYCSVLDTLVMARKMHPGKRVNLDALCRMYTIDNSQRTLHGALLDAEILADVYLMMTGGQADLILAEDSAASQEQGDDLQILQNMNADRAPLPVVRATDEELAVHEEYLGKVRKASGSCIWDSMKAGE